MEGKNRQGTQSRQERSTKHLLEVSTGAKENVKKSAMRLRKGRRVYAGGGKRSCLGKWG